MYPPAWDRLGFTSGRRTYLGNKRVGGVPNSDHLRGTAADFTASEGDLRAYFGPNVKILDEHDHRHVSGLSGVPYYGQNGVAGLVNGVDTSAPNGGKRTTPMTLSSFPPAKPKTLADLQQQPQTLNFSTLGDLMPSTDFSGILAATQTGLAPPKQKFFGKGGPGTYLLGGLADGISQWASAGRDSGHALQGMQQMAQNEQQQQFDREKLNAEIQARKDAILAKAAEPYRFQNNSGDVVALGPNGQTSVLYADPSPKPNWMKVENADGSITMQPGPGGNRPTEAHIEALRNNPNMAADFDAKFGRGMAAYFLGSR